MEEIELLLVGDVNTKLDGVLSDRPLDHVAPVLHAADIRLGNLEGAFGDPTVMVPYKRGWFHSEPESFALVDGLFDGFGCANNTHHGPAIGTSLALLDHAGVAHAGAGRDLAAARVPGIIERKGTRVGLLSYTSVFWSHGHAAGEDTAGVATVRAETAYQPNPRVAEMPGSPAKTRSWPVAADVATASEDIEALRSHVDVVVVYMHWGVSRDDRIAEYQQLLGRALIDAGADVVVGAHPHVPQGIEFHRHGVILYSLGNFVFGWKLVQTATRDGILARITTAADSPWALNIVPTMRTDSGDIIIPEADSYDGRRIMDRVESLCAEFGTVLERVGDGFLVRNQNGAPFGRFQN